MGKIRWKPTKVIKIWDKMGNSMPVERVMRPNQNNMEGEEGVKWELGFAFF